MSFRIVVTEILEAVVAREDGSFEVERYKQVVDELDIRAVMQAVNQRKRGPRAAKKDAAK